MTDRAAAEPAGLDLELLRQVAVAVGYRMLGSRTEAEDLAQEALVRVHAAAANAPVANPEAFTTTVTTRLALDHLRSARVRRERYVGPWLPEPVTDDPVDDAAHVVELASRGRRRVGAGRPRQTVAPADHRRVLDRFLAASRGGDVDDLVELLVEDAVLVSDGGPDIRAARHPIVGRDRLVRFLRVVGPSVFENRQVEVATVNGEDDFVAADRASGDVAMAGTIDVVGDRVAAVWWVLNPEKLRWIDHGRAVASSL